MTLVPSQNYITDTIRGGGARSEDETALHGQLWIDGKQIYKKVIDFGALPNATTKTVAHGITDIDTVIEIKGVAYRYTDNIVIGLPWSSPTLVENIKLSMDQDDSQNVEVVTAANFSAFAQAYVILEYTKS